jgi:hypothetical protein
MTDSFKQSKPVIPDASLLYRRVKFLCTNSAYAGETNIDLQMSHGVAIRLKRRITELKLTLEQVLETTPTELAEKYFSNIKVRQGKFDVKGVRGNVTYLIPDFGQMTREYMKSCAHSGGSTNRKLELQRRVIYEDVYCSQENQEKCKKENLTFYSISNFNRLWRAYEKSNVVPSFRRKEEPGAIAEFDFTGVTMHCKDGTKAQFAVLVLAHSRLTYVEAIPSQNAADSAQSIVNGFKYFGGITETLRIDNFKAAVTCAGRYGGEFTATYRMLADFLGCTLSSMPVRSGWLKGHAEAAVKIATHTLIARMKRRERDGQAFANIKEMNDWLLRHLDLINNHKVRGLSSSRRKIFEEDEKAKLLHVSCWDFHPSQIETKTVPPTARFQIKGHEYCLPANLIGNKVQLELKPNQLVFYEDGRPICTYKRLDNVEGTSTCKGYNPPAQLFIEVLKATPLPMFFEWAQAIGPETLKRTKSILGGAINIDKLRRAFKLLSLPHEALDNYPVFEKFLKSQPSNMGVSKLNTLWTVYPDKSKSTRADPVYKFNILFEKVERKLYGEDVTISWDKKNADINAGESGHVFLNYHKEKSEPSDNGVTINSSDPTPSVSPDPVSANGSDLTPPDSTDLTCFNSCDLTNSTSLDHSNSEDKGE